MASKILKYCLYLFLIFCGEIYSQEFEDEKRLIVFGGAEINTPADNAKFSFEITEKGSTLTEAVKKAKTKINLISKSLFKIGLTQNNLRTTLFNSRENFRDKSFWSSKKDFKAQMTVNISIDSLNLLEPAVLRLSDFKPDEISNIKFNLKNYENVKISALEKAIKKAKEKAELLAKNMNTKLGNVMYIEEIQNTVSSSAYSQKFPNPYNSMSTIKSEPSSIESGNSFFTQYITIRTRVKVIVELAGSNFN